MPFIGTFQVFGNRAEFGLFIRPPLTLESEQAKNTTRVSDLKKLLITSIIVDQKNRSFTKLKSFFLPASIQK